MEKRKNKYPNNRYNKDNMQRTKKISTHTTKKKSNRIGFEQKTIPANTEYFLEAPKIKEDSKKGFLSNIFSKNGYYYYLWFPFMLLLVSVILDFSLQFAVYSNLNPYYVSIAKDSLFFLTFSIILLCVNIGAFIYMGIETAKHNLQYKKAIQIIANIILLILIFETALTLFSFFTFLTPYIQQMFTTTALRSQYLLYLVSWNIIKSVIYLVMASITYVLFFKLKFI